MKLIEARTKIKRADIHIGELEAWISALPDAYISRIEIDPQSSNQTLVHDVKNSERILVDAALLIGDAVHNLKCALDYAWLETIKLVATGAVTRFASFPCIPPRNPLKMPFEAQKYTCSANLFFGSWLTRYARTTEGILPFGPFTF
jgi:hypothetical protein